MPTSSDLVKRKREAEAWEAQMASLRAAEAAKAPVVAEPVVEKTDAEKASEAGRLLRSRRGG